MIPARYFKTIVVDDDVFDNFTNQLEGLPYEVKLALAPKIQRSSGVGKKIAASLSDSDLIGFPYTHQDGSAFKRTELSPFMINRCCDYVVAVTGESVNRVGDSAPCVCDGASAANPNPPAEAPAEAPEAPAEEKTVNPTTSAASTTPEGNSARGLGSCVVAAGTSTILTVLTLSFSRSE